MLCIYLSHLKKQSYIVIAGFASVKEHRDIKKYLSLYHRKVKEKKDHQKVRKNRGNKQKHRRHKNEWRNIGKIDKIL